MNHLGDTNKMVETPRTDAALLYSICLDLQDENNALKARIKRLEEAGDAMADMMILSARIIERESPSALAWLRAKEDKL